jgi:hypothetical protein
MASARVRLFWGWKSKSVGRPALPKNLQELIRTMAAENPNRGEEHIANELKLKLGIRVSPRTVQKYLTSYRGRTPDPSQRWLTFRAQSCPGHSGVRLFRGIHRPIPHPLCTGDHGARQAPDPSSQRDGASQLDCTPKMKHEVKGRPTLNGEVYGFGPENLQPRFEDRGDAGN